MVFLDNGWWLLSFVPHPIRMSLLGAFRPSTLRRYREMRGSVTDEGYSYRPFDEHRCIFVHVPKAAGVSVCRSLFGNLAGGHATVSKYSGLFSRRDFAEYFKFTFVRNPWDRLYSAYRFLRAEGLNPRDRAWARTHLQPYDNFDAFVKRGLARRDVARKWHFRPQNTLLRFPWHRDVAVDFVGYYENLEEDFRYVAGRVFGAAAPTLVHANRTRSPESMPPYTEVYSEVAASIAADVYGEDIELFGYTFDNASIERHAARRTE